MKNRFFIYILAATTLAIQSSCKKDFVNPNAATDQQVFSSPQGLTGVAVGLQRTYTAGRSSSLYNKVNINGLISSELIVLNQGNTGEYQLQLGGGSVDGTNTLAAGLWTSSNKILYDADRVIAGAQALSDKSYASGLIGYASIFKAMALGDLSMLWQKIPDGIGKDVNFIDRVQGYTKAIAVIDDALNAINANAIAPSFLSNIPQGISIPNTLHALKARFSLNTGNYAQALSEANAASASIKSTFNFSTVNLNPIFETVTSTNNVTAAIDNTTLGLPAALAPNPADGRLAFYTTAAYNSKVLGFGAGTVTPWPVYLPGELSLIKAEAYARQSSPDLVNALAQLNAVVTKTAASDAFGLGANLPSLSGTYTQAQILEMIYQQRCIELYMSGMKIEDMRRFGRADSEKKRNLLPFPFQERDNNKNTPADPSF
ncbi:MAG: RagB/SusD family nutrient uptake outer membrane protein [Bacteroidia bacterium]|nr:MAG: RagB/SusD family nutrient uptake outer membrane protein [Bacteroidia bacterium]